MTWPPDDVAPLSLRSYHDLVSECLCESLQRNVRFHIASDIFAGVWWLSACEDTFLEELAVRVTRIAYAPHDAINNNDKLNVIMSGMASRGGVFLKAGDFWCVSPPCAWL